MMTTSRGIHLRRHVRSHISEKPHNHVPLKEKNALKGPGRNITTGIVLTKCNVYARATNSSFLLHLFIFNPRFRQNFLNTSIFQSLKLSKPLVFSMFNATTLSGSDNLCRSM